MKGRGLRPTAALMDAQAKIRDPKNWTRFTCARDRNGVVVPAANSRAVKFCAIGALISVAGVESSASHVALDALRQAAGDTEVAEINDRIGHAAVMALYDRAVVIAKAIQ